MVDNIEEILNKCREWFPIGSTIKQYKDTPEFVVTSDPEVFNSKELDGTVIHAKGVTIEEYKNKVFDKADDIWLYNNLDFGDYGNYAYSDIRNRDEKLKELFKEC